ncbi:nicotinate-nicotinamide nucleotide adenylyltransferase [Candidatus Saccharibacteria bacterium]|nr:nicotinate-nicotinamide nucleotide adenylyltransferase [Candidatus Saccharibacteria bacterium]
MNDFLISWNKKWDKVVVFAGVFDPVHKAHISAAQESLKLGKRVVFLPERAPQHKHGTTAYRHRLAMLQIATNYEAKIDVLDYPQDQQYITPTFEWLLQQYPSSSFVWLVGSDVLPYMHKWPDIDKLKELRVSDVYYIERAGYEVGQQYEVGKGLTAYRLQRKKDRHTHTSHPKINSTTIRAEIKKHQNQLPSDVYEYIRENNLYSLSD